MNEYSYSCQGGYSVPYGGGYNPFRPDPIALKENNEIKRLGFIAGFCCIAFVVMQYVIAYAAYFLGFSNLYGTSFIFDSFYNIIASVMCIFLPFSFATLALRPEQREKVYDFGAPTVSKINVFLAVMAGLFFCLIGDYITSLLSVFVEEVGVSFSSPEKNTQPNGVLENLINIIQIAAIPALFEEFALRGVIMRPLQKYGDTFAIIMSAIIFSIMHGNMIQIPFAFIAGIAIGYFVIRTGSIWTGIIIHFCNNLLSAVYGATSDRVYMIILGVIFIIGLVSFILFTVKNKENKLKKSSVQNKNHIRAAVYLAGPLMVISFVLMYDTTLDYISPTNSLGSALITMTTALLLTVGILICAYLINKKPTKNINSYYVSMGILVFIAVIRLLSRFFSRFM